MSFLHLAIGDDFPANLKTADENGQLSLEPHTNMEVVRMLMDRYPESVRTTNDSALSLHSAAAHTINLEVVQLLLDRRPEAVMTANNDGALPLHFAAATNGNVEVVRLLLDRHPEGVRAATNDGALPLHLAAAYNSNVEVVRLLLEMHPEGVKVANSIWALPLHYAAAYNSNVEVMRVLLDAYPEGAKATIKDNALPLHMAAGTNNNVEVVRLLLEMHPDSVGAATTDGTLPLHCAASHNNNVEVVRVLLEVHPEAVRTVIKKGALPLHLAAAHNNNVEVVRLLLEAHPVGVMAADQVGHLPLHWAAARSSNVEIVLWLTERHPEALMVTNKNGALPLHVATENNSNAEVVRVLLDRCPEGLRVYNNNGDLPLHMAATHNSNVEVVRLVLEVHPEGARAIDNDGALPLHRAAALNSNVEVVRLLLDVYPEGVRAVTNDGSLPLHRAAALNTNVEVARLLLDVYPEGVTIADKYGALSLYLAAANNSNVEVVRLLLMMHPVGVTTADKYGALPLHFAAETTRSVEVVRLLLEVHPEAVRTVIKNNALPLHYAVAYNSNVEVVRLLLEAHPEGVMAATNDGALPLHFAAAYNSNVEVMRVLLNAYPEGAIATTKNNALPLHMAAGTNSNVEVVRVLLEMHPEGVMAADRDGRLPLHVAAEYNSNVEVMRMLLAVADCSVLFEDVLPLINTLKKLGELADKSRMHSLLVGMVKVVMTNPRYSTSLRDIISGTATLELSNLRKALGGVIYHKGTTVNVHICGEKLAGKTTLTTWLQQKLKQPTTWLGRVSTVFTRPQLAPVIDFDARTPGLLVHHVDCLGEVHFVLHDYGGHAEFRKVYRRFLNAPQSIYVVVLPLVEKLGNTDYRAYSIEAVVSQYCQWLGQIHNAIQSEPRSSATVITVLNTFSGVFPEAELPSCEELRKRLKEYQDSLSSAFIFSPFISVDSRNEHDSVAVCMAIEASATKLRAATVDGATTKAVSFRVVEDLRNSFDRQPITSQFLEVSQYRLEIRRRLLECGYREEDELRGSLDLLVDWWIADSLRMRRIMSLSRGLGREAVVATSVEALSHLLFGKVLDAMRRRSAVVIRRDTVRQIAQEIISIGLQIDAADLLVDLGLFTRIVAYDADSGRVDLRSDVDTASDGDLFLVIGLIEQPVEANDLSPPEFRPETTRRIHRWYMLDHAKAMDWGPDFFVALFQCVLSLAPTCAGPRIYKDGIYVAVEDARLHTTYVVRPHCHASLGEGFEVIIDVSAEDVAALTVQNDARQDDVVWMGLQQINATCRRLVGEGGLQEYCLYPDPRRRLSDRLAVDVKRELEEAIEQGLEAQQLLKYLYGHFPLRRLT